MKLTSISQLPHADLRALASRVDQSGDGKLSTKEVDAAISTLAAKAADGVDTKSEMRALSQLRTMLSFYGGAEAGAVSSSAASAPAYSPFGLQAGAMSGTAVTGQDAPTPHHLGSGSRIDSSARMYRTSGANRHVEDGQPVLVPLDSGKLHMIELKYQDTRKLRDLEFNVRKPGEWNWKTIRGDEYHAALKSEKSGDLQIKRERDHNAPWINNPVRVKVEILYPNGKVHSVGKKFLDFHVHDAHSADSSGYPETDNINNSYENLPKTALPEGCLLRLTPMFVDKKPWEADRDIAAELSWVKPIFMPEYEDKVRISSGHSYQKPPAEGFSVDPDRKIAGLLVNWTDHGKASSGSVRIQTEDGAWRSSRYNVGSGETELIPVDNIQAKDGRVRVEGYGVDVRHVDVLYAD